MKKGVGERVEKGPTEGSSKKFGVCCLYGCGPKFLSSDGLNYRVKRGAKVVTT